jgi:glycosyltransferase involved in cell wall biosynthesis
MSVPSDLAGLKIVIMVGTFIRGGCERQAFLLARELIHRHGLNAEVWALKFPGEYSREFEAAGIPTKTLYFEHPRYGWVQRSWPVLRELRKSRVDILLPFTTWPNVVAGLTYRLAGVRLCIWGERHAGGERIPGVERLAVTQYRRFVANSTAGVEFLANVMRVKRECLSFVPNGIESPKVDPGTDWRGKLGLKPEQLLVVKVANVTNFKDHATLLRAWKIVQDEWRWGGDKPVLALAGYLTEDVYPECERITREAGIESTVRFLGGITDVPTLLNACDMTAFSSRKEGMPNGVLECMAAGKAVVATDLPGIRDALGPDCADMLVTPGDPGQFALKLLDLLRNRAKRESLGAANAARIRSEFSVERMTERHLQVIREGLDGPRPMSLRLPQLAQERSRA